MCHNFHDITKVTNELHFDKKRSTKSYSVAKFGYTLIVFVQWYDK